MRKILMMAVLAFLSLQGVGARAKEETGSTGRYGQERHC